MRRALSWSTSLLLAAAIAGCGMMNQMPPQQLQEARETLGAAKQGPAAQFAPAKLDEAEAALNKAEQWFRQYGDIQETRDLAYIAHRKATEAEVAGKVGKLKDQVARGERQVREIEVSLVQQLEVERQRAELERARRIQAERRADETARRLRDLANTREDERGTVVTLESEVLFDYNSANLRPQAQDKLREIAEVLRDTDRPVRIEGHTDSTGDAGYNLQLSEDRAQSVRDFLTSQGVPMDQISANGVGETQPVASNGSPEGRQLNRRVEIIVQRQPGEEGEIQRQRR